MLSTRRPARSTTSAKYPNGTPSGPPSQTPNVLRTQTSGLPPRALHIVAAVVTAEMTRPSAMSTSEMPRGKNHLRAGRGELPDHVPLRLQDTAPSLRDSYPREEDHQIPVATMPFTQWKAGGAAAARSLVMTASSSPPRIWREGGPQMAVMRLDSVTSPSPST